MEGLLIREKQVEMVSASVSEIYKAGGTAGAVYYARSGMVKLAQDHGPEGQTLGIVRPGEVFGEEILLGDSAYRAKATRIVAGEILRIPALLFQRMASRYPELWRGLAAQLQQRLVLEQRSFRRLVNVGTDQRIVAMLEQLAPSCPVLPAGAGERPVHGVPLTQAELAVLVGASRETTSSVLNAMERQGTVELRRGRILIAPRQSRGAHAGGD